MYEKLIDGMQLSIHFNRFLKRQKVESSLHLRLHEVFFRMKMN